MSVNRRKEENMIYSVKQEGETASAPEHKHIPNMKVNENKQSWETTHDILQPQSQPKHDHTIHLLLSLSSQFIPRWAGSGHLSSVSQLKEPN